MWSSMIRPTSLTRERISQDFNTRFGLVIKSLAGNGYNLNHLYHPFVHEAYRVLKPEGILFCKITDYIHDHRYHAPRGVHESYGLWFSHVIAS